jgi:hypothetical protein
MGPGCVKTQNRALDWIAMGWSLPERLFPAFFHI